MPAYLADTNATTLITCGTTGVSDAATTINNLIFTTWNQTASMASTVITWQTWVDTSIDTAVAILNAPMDPRTIEQRRADEARYQERLARELQERTDATAKARALLISLLAPEQRASLERDRYFDVIARGSQRRYRIRQGTHGNVKLLDAAGREVISYCGQPGGVPTEDAMLAQKLQIEHDEQTFLRLANATPLRVA